MRVRKLAVPAFGLLALIVAACGGGGGGGTSIVTPPQKNAGQGKMALTLAVPAPPKGANVRVRKAFAISASTQGLLVHLYTTPYTGTSTPVFTQSYDVSATSSTCAGNSDGSRTCTLYIPIAPGTYDVQALSYDQAPLSGTIPVTANQLGYGFLAAQAVNAGATNTLGLTVEGIPNSVVVNMPAHAVRPMYALTQNASVSVLDKAGSVIMGPFIDAVGNTVTVTMSDSAGTGVATFSPASFTSSLSTGVSVTYNPNNLTAALVGSSFSILVTGTLSNNAAYASAAISVPKLLTTYSGIGGGPAGLTTGSDNQLWFTLPSTERINSLSPFSGSVGPSPLPATGGALGSSPQPDAVINGPDNNLWYSNSAVNAIGTVALTGPTPIGYTLSSGYASALTQDGTYIWGAEPSANNVFRMTTAGASIEIPIPTSNSAPNGIAVDGSGDIWFTEQSGNKIGEILSGTTTVAHEYSTGLSANASPLGIAKGADGNMYFAESGADRIGEITSNGTITEYVMNTGSFVPEYVTSGPDGAIWFTVNGGIFGVGRFDLTTHAFSLVPLASSAALTSIVVGADKNVWIGDSANAAIYRIAL